MSYNDWRLVVGDQQKRVWGNNNYIFRIGKDQRNADPIYQELKAKTPLRKLIDTAVDDDIIRAITFLSYYLVNPTFRHDDNDSVGSNFFWFPLDKLNSERYDNLFGDIEETDEELEDEEEDEDEEEAALPDFPIMSTVGQPVIEAAVSDNFITQSGRVSTKERHAILQEEIRKKQEELMEEIEEWLEEGINSDRFSRNFSSWAESMGRLPARILLGGIYHERSRIEEIHKIFTSMDPSSSPEELSPEILLRKLANLTEDYPVLINPAIEAFCLDQHDRDCEFHITKHRGYELENSLEQCEHCGSDLYRVFRAGIDDTVKDAWMMGLLPELLTARILETCEWVDEVIPHRLVQMDNDGQLTSSVEVDVSVHTQEDEVLFFEVTSQRDALNRVIKKKNKFEENGIDYDGIIQLSLTDNDEFIEFGDKTIAGGAWMIPGLESEEFYNDIQSRLDLERP